MSMEVITTTDKDQRDRLFNDLRQNGNDLEKQVVKFSGIEPVLDKDGLQETNIIGYHVTTPNKVRNFCPKPQGRPVWRSTWSVAYPLT